MNFLGRKELERKLKVAYPDVLTEKTNLLRKENIIELVKFIQRDIKKNHLVHKKKERRIKLHTTLCKEDIYIQYPGKYSQKNEKPLLYDFRPIAILPDGKKSIDMSFQDIWANLEKYISDHKIFMGIINTILFRMGRMIDYKQNKKIYPTQFIINNNDTSPQPADDKELSLFMLNFDDEFVNSINILTEKIDAGEGREMSIEAFLYYFEFLLQIEDCKYNYEKCINGKKLNQVGRISTSDSLIAIYLCKEGLVTLSKTLMRFLQGRGVAHCDYEEYIKATNSIVSIISVKNIKSTLRDNYNIESDSKQGCLPIKPKIRIPSKNIAIIEDDLPSSEVAKIEEMKWHLLKLEDFYDEGSLDRMYEIITNTPSN